MTFEDYLSALDPDVTATPEPVCVLARRLKSHGGLPAITYEGELLAFVATLDPPGPPAAASFIWNCFNHIVSTERAVALQVLVMSEALRLANLAILARPTMTSQGDVMSRITRTEAIGILAEGIFALGHGPDHPNNALLMRGLANHLVNVHNEFLLPQIAALGPPGRPILLN
jgi:hypothetical protein